MMNHISTVCGGEHVGASPVRVIGLRILGPRFSATTEDAGFFMAMKRQYPKRIDIHIRSKQLFATRPDVEVYFHGMLKAACGKHLKIQAQKTIGPYVVDFAVKRGKRKVAIEIDGGYHTLLKQHLIDIQKTDYFIKSNYSVWRMTPEAAYQMTREQIIKELTRLLSHLDVTWQSGNDVEYPLDPALQFKQYV